MKNKRNRRYQLHEQHKAEVSASCRQPLLKKLVWMRAKELGEAEDSYLGTTCSCWVGQIVLEQWCMTKVAQEQT